MNSLTFNEKEISKADVKDLMRFMSQIQSDDRFKNNGRLFVNKLNETDDEVKTMINIEISFQFFKTKDKVGKSFIWKQPSKKINKHPPNTLKSTMVFNVGRPHYNY